MNFEILAEEFVTKGEVKKILSGKKNLELEQKLTKEHVSHYKKLTLAKIKELKTKLQELNITKLKPEIITKIIDILPQDIQDLELILKMSIVPFTKEEIEKIFECVKPYVQ